MPVTTNYVPLAYAGDGITNSFVVSWPFQLQTDLVVSTLVVATNTTTLLVLGTDYIVTPTLNSPANTGTVTTTVAVPVGTELLIARDVPITQLTTWVPNDPNLSTSTMNAVDKLTLIVQDMQATPFDLGGNSSEFLRGDNVLTNTLIGPDGAVTVPADTQAVFNANDNGVAAFRVLSGATSAGAYRFGHDGSSNAWDMQLGYDPVTGKIGWYAFGGSALGTFDTSGNVDITGSFTGHADASLIDSGTIALARLGTNSPAGNLFLSGNNTWAVPSGGGGVNTTTTGTFTIAAVTASQTVPVTATTGITVGTYLQVSDGTHTIIGHVTNIASLDLTVVTDSIILGSAGSTMASGAAVQLATAPGQNVIFVQDAVAGPVTMGTMILDGNPANRVEGVANVDMYIDATAGPLVTLRGYSNTHFAITSIHSGASSNDFVTVKRLADSHWTSLAASAQGDVLHATSSTVLGFGKITASDSVTSGTITASLLNSTNGLTNGYVPSYDSGTGNFTWVANGGSIPGGGTTANFFRGDNTFTNSLTGPINIDLSSSTTFRIGVANIFGGTTPVQAYMEPVVSGTPTVLPLQIASQVALGGTQYNTIDTTNVVELLQVNAIARATAFRSTCGPWLELYVVVGGGAVTIDLANGSYQRIATTGSNTTITLADTTPLPSARRFASELTLEITGIQSSGSFDYTWPGTITWANGGVAPTVANGGLNATGINLIRLIRRQGQTQWVGYVDNAASAAPYTDAQARSAVLNSTYLVNSSTIDMSVVAGTSATPFVKTGSLTNTHIATGANISPSKLLGAGSSTTTFLRNDGTWQVPPGTGGGGGGNVLNTGSYTWTNVSGQTWQGTNTFNAKNTFNGPQVFTSNGFGSPVAGLAVGQASFNNYYPNDNLSPELACTARFTLTNSYAGGASSEILGLSVTQTNNSVTGGEGQGCAKFYNEVLQNITSGFSISLQEVASFRQVNGASADGVWLNAWSPCAQFAATPDATGVIHSFGSGDVRIGEVNYGNAWADLGFIDDRGSSKFVAGLEFFPDWLPGSTGATTFTKFNASWAIAIGGAGARAGSGDPDPKNWTGILFSENGIAPLGIGVNMHGGSSSGNAPAVGINFQNHLKTGINFAGSAGGAPIGTGGGTAATIDPETISGHSNQPAITLAQGQAICFAPSTGANTGVYIVYDGTHLKATINGGNTFTNII